jgi:dethiobiotin synthetase
MKTAYFIAGTDTGVGKTLVSSALVYGYAQLGLKSAGMKPIAAGCESIDGRWLSEDVAQLQAASNIDADLSLVNPYAFAPAIAPHIAAEQAGVRIELTNIQSAYETLRQSADVVIVEGVGGFRVPLGSDWDTANLAQALALPVVLVVGMRLGCLSHALLTVEAIEKRGLSLAGWVANRIDPDMTAYAENLDALRQRIDAPLLGQIPALSQADFRLAAKHLTLP